MWRFAFALATLSALAACAASEPRPSELPPLAAEDAASPPLATTPSTDAAADALAIAPPPTLPSGDYEITTEVVKDTCSGLDGGTVVPAAATMFVPMRIWRDKAGLERVTASLPLPLPSRGGYGTARSDVTLSPPVAPREISLHGLGSQCPSYETRTRYEVLTRTADTVRVAYARDYGDGSTCPRRVPSGCTLEYVYTYRLVRAVCSAACGVTFAKGPEAGLTPRCHCDGG